MGNSPLLLFSGCYTTDAFKIIKFRSYHQSNPNCDLRCFQWSPAAGGEGKKKKNTGALWRSNLAGSYRIHYLVSALNWHRAHILAHARTNEPPIYGYAASSRCLVIVFLFFSLCCLEGIQRAKSVLSFLIGRWCREPLQP